MSRCTDVTGRALPHSDHMDGQDRLGDEQRLALELAAIGQRLTTISSEMRERSASTATAVMEAPEVARPGEVPQPCGHDRPDAARRSAAAAAACECAAAARRLRRSKAPDLHRSSRPSACRSSRTRGRSTQPPRPRCLPASSSPGSSRRLPASSSRGLPRRSGPTRSSSRGHSSRSRRARPCSRSSARTAPQGSCWPGSVARSPCSASCCCWSSPCSAAGSARCRASSAARCSAARWSASACGCTATPPVVPVRWRWPSPVSPVSTWT